MIRTPSVTDSSGGARSEKQASERGQMVKTADQMVQLAFENGLKVSPAVEASLMPTPTTRDYKDGQAEHERDGVVQTDTVARAVFNSGEIELMGTPQTSPAHAATEKQVKAGAPKARIEDQVLLPTPTAVDGNTVARSELDAGDPKHRLKVQAQVLARDGVTWGKFEPAIRRWETVLGRPAPAPTKPDGKDGAHRLSPNFVEWMMGLDSGWVVDSDLTRNEMLRMLGNGVVPQQAELALRILLEGVDLENGGKIEEGHRV